MNLPLVWAYAMWIGSFALFAWLSTLPGGSTFVALIASLAVLTWATRRAAKDSTPWRP